MSKISTYSLADSPLQLSDRLIGTEAVRPIPSPTPLATKNFSLGELLQLFSSNFPAATLQAVLNAGNIATQDINLTGTINVTLIKPTNIEDMLGSQGTTFQILSKAIGGFNWVDPPVSITLTTTGSSGPSTLIGGVLNIPVYTGGVDTIPTLQQVVEQDNLLTDAAIVFDSISNPNLISTVTIYGLTFIENDGVNEEVTNFSSTGMQRSIYSNITLLDFETPTNPNNVVLVPNATGTLALTSDIIIPTLDQVLNEGYIGIDKSILLDTSTNVGYASLNYNQLVVADADYGSSLSKQTLVFNSSLTTNSASYGVGSIGFSTSSSTATGISFENPTGLNSIVVPDKSGTLALTSDIPDTSNLVPYQLGGGVSKSINLFDEVGNVGSLKLPDNLTQDRLLLFQNKDYTGIADITDIPTSTSQLTNDGADGVNPFITAADIPASTGIKHATASGTDTYTATIAGVTSYSDADAYLIRFTNGNTTGATLNINSLGARPLYRNNDGPLLGGDVGAGGEMLCVYNSTTNVFQCIGTAPNSLFAYITNDDSVTITKGMPVYAFSGTGDRMTVKRANNSNDSTSAQTVGLVLSASIAPNQKGFILMQGLLDGLNILPTATWSDGDAVYLGATAGAITKVKPYAPNHLVYLGVVTTASNGAAGRMYVRVQNGYELSEIHDVDLVSNTPTNNQVLTYELATDLWKNKTIVEDAIVNGVTDKAPSQNAVFDALDNLVELNFLRQNVGYIIPSGLVNIQTGFNVSPNLASWGLTLQGNTVTGGTGGFVRFNTTATAGTLAFRRGSFGIVLGNYQFEYTQKVRFQTNLTGQRGLWGLSSGYTYASPTNVEPNTNVNVVGVCQLSTSTNLHIIHNDGSGIATTIDLGVDYPCNTNIYTYYIRIKRITTNYTITVERITNTDNSSISTVYTTSTNIPAIGTGDFSPINYITNNAQAVIASYFDGGCIAKLTHQ